MPQSPRHWPTLQVPDGDGKASLLGQLYELSQFAHRNALRLQHRVSCQNLQQLTEGLTLHGLSPELVAGAFLSTDMTGSQYPTNTPSSLYSVGSYAETACLLVFYLGDGIAQGKVLQHNGIAGLKGRAAEVSGGCAPALVAIHSHTTYIELANRVSSNSEAISHNLIVDLDELGKPVCVTLEHYSQISDTSTINTRLPITPALQPA